ncbi:unnamed protein product [Linum tenue]|uniref:Uncharacterized protein n=1 Tax=Linum tenue TaxID=586396 RepID=A0AAV0J7Y6_9ROSI|nr:unnamed protein product [Linum tenue]
MGFLSYSASWLSLTGRSSLSGFPRNVDRRAASLSPSTCHQHHGSEPATRKEEEKSISMALLLFSPSRSLKSMVGISIACSGIVLLFCNCEGK